MPIQDVDIEELEKKGWKRFRSTIGENGEIRIHPDDWEAFEEWANSPLTEEEKAYLKECREIYEGMPIHRSKQRRARYYVSEG